MGTATSTTTTSSLGFDDLIVRMQQRLAARLEQHSHLFTTDVEGLYDRFLEALPEERRQHYRCSACRSFVTRCGGLVVIDAQGVAASALWGEPKDGLFVDELAAGVRAMAAARIVPRGSSRYHTVSTRYALAAQGSTGRQRMSVAASIVRRPALHH